MSIDELAYARGFTVFNRFDNYTEYIDDMGIKLIVFNNKYDFYEFFYRVNNELKVKSTTYCNFTSKNFTDNYRRFRKEVKDYWSHRGG